MSRAHADLARAATTCASSGAARAACIQSPRPASRPDRPLVPRRYNGASSRAATQAGSHRSVSKLLFLVIAIIVVYFVLTGLARSEEHTSELQSQFHLVCRLLLEKKK